MSKWYQPPHKNQMMYSMNYYSPTQHFGERYRERMREHTASETTQERLLSVSDDHLGRRANYMLMFSIHGRPGARANTEVRYYFEWDIVVDNLNKTIITMYINSERNMPPTRKFGDRQMRRFIYNLWFRPNSKVRRKIKSAV